MGWIDRIMGRTTAQRAVAVDPADTEERSGLDALLGGGVTTLGNTAPGVMETLALPPVWAAVSILRDDIARLPVQVWRTDGDQPAHDTESRTARTLAHTANSEQSAFEFWRWAITSCCLHGDAIATIVRDNAGDVVALVPDLDRHITPMKQADGFVRYVRAGNAGVSAGELIHLRWPSVDGITAESPVRMLAQTWATIQAMGNTAEKFFHQGARPTGVLRFEGSLKPDQAKAIRDQWQTAMGRGSAVGGLLVLDNNGQFQPMAASFESAQFAELLAHMVQQVARVFRIAPYLLQDLSRATYSNVGEAMRAHYRMTLAPWCSMIQAELEHKLFPDGGVDVRHDGDPILRGDARERFETYEIALRAGFLTVDEIRARENLPPLPAQPAAPDAPDEQEGDDDATD